jgi:uncharacterized damage-inducible protein DinB
MTIADLRRLFDYGYWANRKLFDVIATMTPEQYTRMVGGSYGSIRNTLVHTLSAEWGWLDRCGGMPRGPALKPDDFPSFAALREQWAAVERGVRAFLDSLGDGDLERPVEFTLPGRGAQVMRVGELMQHAANHGVHHRGQLVLLIRLLGCTPGNVDLLIYDGERRASATA